MRRTSGWSGAFAASPKTTSPTVPESPLEIWGTLRFAFLSTKLWVGALASPIKTALDGWGVSDRCTALKPSLNLTETGIPAACGWSMMLPGRIRSSSNPGSTDPGRVRRWPNTNAFTAELSWCDRPRSGISEYSAARLLCACSHSKTVLLVDSRPWGRGLLDGLRLGIPRCPKCLGNGGSEEALRWTSPINRRPVEASEAVPKPCSGGLVTEVTGRSTWPGWVKSSAAVAVTFWDVFVGSRRLLGSALALGTLGSALALGASHKDGSSTDVWLIKEHCQIQWNCNFYTGGLINNSNLPGPAFPNTDLVQTSKRTMISPHSPTWTTNFWEPCWASL